MEEVVKKTAVFKKERAEIFIYGKYTMLVENVDQFKSHTGSAIHRVLISASGTETAVTAKRDKFKIATLRAPIHGTTKRRVTTINHLLDVFNDSIARMKGVNHFFIMIGKNSLKDIHTIIMQEKRKKNNPQSPS